MDTSHPSPSRVDYRAAFPQGMEEAPYFSERERAALAWCEALTDLPRTGAPDGHYAALEAVFDAEEIAELTFAVVAINSWNRLAVGLRSDVTTLDGVDHPVMTGRGPGRS